jgi:hypothetical protein
MAVNKPLGILLDRLATLQSNAPYSHTAVAVQNREQAVALQALVA